MYAAIRLCNFLHGVHVYIIAISATTNFFFAAIPQPTFEVEMAGMTFYPAKFNVPL